MTNNARRPTRVVVEPIDRGDARGWAVVDAESWNEIDRVLLMVARLEDCHTWGEVRSLGPLDSGLLELVDEQNNVEGSWPDDALPFGFDQSKGEWYERASWLCRATTDLLGLLWDRGDFLPHIDRISNESWVTDGHIDQVVEILVSLGCEVLRVEHGGHGMPSSES